MRNTLVLGNIGASRDMPVTSAKPFVPPAPLRTPVLFLVFNRPEPTSQVFAAIREAKPPRLYVAADGPRSGQAQDPENVFKVRQIATAVDWPCEVRILFRDTNLGCQRAVSEALIWFFADEENGIILEDDCLPSQSFFWFCEAALMHFATDTRVGMVTGRNELGRFPENADVEVFLSSRGFIWGWATWRRCLEADFIEHVEQGGLKLFLKLILSCTSITELLYRLSNLYAIRSGRVKTWDYPWNILQLLRNRKCLVPAKNLVRNIGFGINATHTKTSHLDTVPLFELNAMPNFSNSREFRYFAAATIRKTVASPWRIAFGLFYLLLRDLFHFQGNRF